MVPEAQGPTRTAPEPQQRPAETALAAILDRARAELSKTQFEALKVLAVANGSVVPHQELLDTVWGHSYVEVGAIHILMHHLRKRIEIGCQDCPAIVSVPGVGYRLGLKS